jgi:hypothetical protein
MKPPQLDHRFWLLLLFRSAALPGLFLNSHLSSQLF